MSGAFTKNEGVYGHIGGDYLMWTGWRWLFDVDRLGVIIGCGQVGGGYLMWTGWRWLFDVDRLEVVI